MPCLRCGDCCRRLEVRCASVTKGLMECHFGAPVELSFLVEHTCMQLTAEGLCSLYGSTGRPDYCKRFLCERARKNG